MLVFSILSVLLIFPSVQSKLNILAIFPYQGKSHFLAYEPLLKALSGKGHQVTVISYFPQQEQVANYNDISLADKEEYESWNYATEPSYLKIIWYSIYLIRTGMNNCKVLLSDENVQRLWNDKKKFDVVLVEQFNSDCALALAYKLRAPVVGITSQTLMAHHFSRFGIPNNPSYTPFQLLNGGTKPSLVQRIERTIFMIYFQYFVRVISQTIDHYTLSQYFDRMPSLEELGKHTKLMLINEHFVFFAPTILPTNVKQIGGFHIAENKSLPTDLENFINGSQKGVIYINLGNINKNTSLAPEKLDAILTTISKLRRRVIWKWEEDLPVSKKEVYVSKWLPQNDILAHSKVRAMFSNCGLLGLTEAIYHGIPVICMPMFGDQARNAAAVKETGLGVIIQVNELNNDTLFEKLTTVLDTKFRKKVKVLSKMWRDRPKKARQEAIYWIEYAARYANSTFRCEAADVPMYQYLCLDVLLFFAFLFGPIIIYFVKYMLKVYKSKFEDTKKVRKFKWKRP